MHSPSTASGVATALRASKSRQNHSSVCSGSPLRSRPVKGQPPAPNARLGAAPPCELQPRRWPTQLTLREACPGSGMKGGCFSVRATQKNNARALSGAGKRTAASGVAWSGCASLRGPLCAGEALLEARTQASVALFKLGAHSATLRPEFGGPKSLRCCCAKGVGHRAQLMLRARRGDRENNHPVPLLRTPTPQNALSLLSSLRGVTTTKSLD